MGIRIGAPSAAVAHSGVRVRVGGVVRLVIGVVVRLVIGVVVRFVVELIVLVVIGDGVAGGVADRGRRLIGAFQVQIAILQLGLELDLGPVGVTEGHVEVTIVLTIDGVGPAVGGLGRDQGGKP